MTDLRTASPCTRPKPQNSPARPLDTLYGTAGYRTAEKILPGDIDLHLFAGLGPRLLRFRLQFKGVGSVAADKNTEGAEELLISRHSQFNRPAAADGIVPGRQRFFQAAVFIQIDLPLQFKLTPLSFSLNSTGKPR